jgi:hypothetical protein
MKPTPWTMVMKRMAMNFAGTGQQRSAKSRKENPGA